MNRLRLEKLLLIGILLLTGGLLSCGGGGGGVTPGPLDGDFTLDILDDTYLDGQEAMQFDVHTTSATNTTTVEVSVRDAKNLKALFYTLAFDSSKYNPVSVTSTGALEGLGNVLTASYTEETGQVYHGLILSNPAGKSGLSGQAGLAQIVFENTAQPAGDDKVSTPSALPDKTPLAWDAVSSTLNWLYSNHGDYNQDGVVSITDLAPVAVNFGAVGGTEGFSENSAKYLVDGSGNGTIGLEDIQVLLENWGKNVGGGYNVYATMDCEEYPVYEIAPSTIGALATVPLASAAGDRATDRVQFSYTIANPMDGVLYWVRPTSSDGAEGISSDLLLGTPPEAGLWLANPPAICPDAPYVVEEGDVYTLILDDPNDGNVTTDPGASYSIDPAGAATISGSALTVSDSYKGWFTVHATYNGNAVQPGLRETSQSSDGGGLGFYVPEPDSIFALPSQTEVRAGEKIEVTVYTWETAYPLKNMNCVSIAAGDSLNYVADSFNVGCIGHDRDYPDGVWAGGSITEVLEFPENLITMTEDFVVGPHYSFNITPFDGNQITSASGALFNFEMQLLSDTKLTILDNGLDVLTLYNDETYGEDGQPTRHHWTHYDNSDIPTITTYGELPQMILRLTEQVEEGDGSEGYPYQIEADTDYTFSLLSDIYGDVSVRPETEYTVTPDIAGTLSNTDATLVLDPEYTGSIKVEAEYGGIPCEEPVYLFLSGLRDDYVAEFYVSDETYMCGGSADDIHYECENSWDTNEFGYQEEFLKIDIVAEGAQNLKALGCHMWLNPDLITFHHAGNRSAMDKENGLLTIPDDVLVNEKRKVYDENPGYSFDYVQVMVNPDEVEGFSGDGTLVSLMFRKSPQLDSNDALPDPPGTLQKPTASFDPETNIFRWYHYLGGDYNQDGWVGYEDMFALALHFGETVPPNEPNSIQAVIDADYDTRIGLGDLSIIFANFHSVFNYMVIYAGPESSYANEGTEIAAFDRHSMVLNYCDPENERIWYEYEIPDPQPGDGYWVFGNGFFPSFSEFVPGI